MTVLGFRVNRFLRPSVLSRLYCAREDAPALVELPLTTLRRLRQNSQGRQPPRVAHRRMTEALHPEVSIGKDLQRRRRDPRLCFLEKVQRSRCWSTRELNRRRRDR